MIRVESALWVDVMSTRRKALDAYESLLQHTIGVLDPFINAAFICWEFADPGISAEAGLPSGQIDDFWSRAMALLRQAQKLFPEDPEPEFWERYFQVVTLGEPDFVDEFEARLKANDVLVPYFYLAQHRADQDVRQLTETLIRRSEWLPTRKNRYVAHMARRALK